MTNLQVATDQALLWLATLAAFAMQLATVDIQNTLRFEMPV